MTASASQHRSGPQLDSRPRLDLADAGEAADLAAFLARLIHYDKAAAVRLQAGGGVLAVFGRPASFEVLAIRTARLTAEAGGAGPSAGAAPAAEALEAVGTDTLDITVSAGQLADAIDAAGAVDVFGPAQLAPTPSTAAATVGSSTVGGLGVLVPAAVIGPPWAGVLPPRGGWRRVPGLPASDAVRAAVAAAVAEFRARDEALPEEGRTRAERDRIGNEIWSRTLGDTALPLRAVHAAQSLGFLRPVRTADAEPLVLLAAGGWLRLRTPYGSIAVRRAGLGSLMVTPT
ncbi:hypothetical protein [Streptomyces sp. H27-D2]|uniref:hypothetical protein n=1 Tax=Streptomyces sp. H27-D2 TaxID=3046304 RepID=UPI002DBB253C|nr:hypothetical protein [Streptomyces sp. H27-D2]MEC4020753.1 hypothetical protein [Streptomyces sp. H27-D2]